MQKFRGQVFWWAVYATAFGLTEAALVVYVRRLLNWPPGLDYAEILAAQGETLHWRMFTEIFAREGVLGVEIAREAGTILLLLGAAMAAGSTLREKAGLFLFTFAVWDLTYYLWLYLLIGFPRHLAATDVYFLIPITWYGPVWFPVCVVMPLLLVWGLRWMRPSPAVTSPQNSPD